MTGYKRGDWRSRAHAWVVTVSLPLCALHGGTVGRCIHLYNYLCLLLCVSIQGGITAEGARGGF